MFEREAEVTLNGYIIEYVCWGREPNEGHIRLLNGIIELVFCKIPLIEALKNELEEKRSRGMESYLII